MGKLNEQYKLTNIDLKYLNYIKDKTSFIGKVYNEFIKQLLINQSMENKKYEIFAETYANSIIFYFINKDFFNFIKTIQENSLLGESEKINNIEILSPYNDLKSFIFEIGFLSNYLLISSSKIGSFNIKKDNIFCNEKSKSKSYKISVLNNNFVYACKGFNFRSYPASLKTVSYLSTNFAPFRELFLCYFKCMKDKYPIFRDIYKDLEKGNKYIYCNLLINESINYTSYQQWIMGHYKTVLNVPKSVNKECINIAVHKALACRYVENNYQQKIYQMKIDHYVLIESQNDILKLYYTEKLNDVNSFDISIIEDYIGMAIYLRSKMNMRVKSFSKIKDEHNQMINPYMQKKAKQAKTAKMTIPKKSIFRELKLSDNFEIIKTGKRLYEEGIFMHHCVYSYLTKVNKGKCVIAHLIYKDIPYTLEIAYKNKKYICKQIYGKWDKPAPKEVWNYVNEELKKNLK